MFDTAKYIGQKVAERRQTQKSGEPEKSRINTPLQREGAGEKPVTSPSDALKLPYSEPHQNQLGDIEAAEGTQQRVTEVDKKAARNYRWKIIIGLILPSVLEALDTTIIASSPPFIASDFSE
jgi:hypothetical protein